MVISNLDVELFTCFHFMLVNLSVFFVTNKIVLDQWFKISLKFYSWMNFIVFLRRESLKMVLCTSYPHPNGVHWLKLWLILISNGHWFNQIPNEIVQLSLCIWLTNGNNSFYCFQWNVIHLVNFWMAVDIE